MNVPDDLRYAKSHEWLRADGTVGITDHAQHELTDVVFVDLPAVGKVVATNAGLSANPALVNTDPYGEGWMFKLELSSPAERDALMDAAAYRAVTGA